MSSFFSWLWPSTVQAEEEKPVGSSASACTLSTSCTSCTSDEKALLIIVTPSRDHWEQICLVGSNKDHYLKHITPEEIAMNKFTPPEGIGIWTPLLFKAPRLQSFLETRLKEIQ